MNGRYGKYTDGEASWKHNPKDHYNNFLNNITRRNRDLTENLPSKTASSSLLSAGLKSLRLYRHICRLLPYLVKIHEINHRTTPEQAKIFVGNHFRANSHMKNLSDIDYKIDVGYEMLHDAEWHYSQTGYLYKFLMSPKGILRDHGIDHFQDYRGSKLNREAGAASPFLKKFYKGHKSYEV